MPTFSQWQTACDGLGIISDQQLFQELIKRYSEPHRYYHTCQHLDECLVKFHEIKYLADFPAIIEMALWFHDAEYDPLRYDNEQRSADWAAASLLALGTSQLVANKIHHLTLCTRHDEKPVTEEAKIMVDVDLTILAAEPDRYAEYETQVRKEYPHIDENRFCQKRSELLLSFLNRKTIFNTSQFIDRYEQTARRNIHHALEQLSAKQPKHR